jgi:hypothetical protein
MVVMNSIQFLKRMRLKRVPFDPDRGFENLMMAICLARER